MNEKARNFLSERLNLYSIQALLYGTRNYNDMVESGCLFSTLVEPNGKGIQEMKSKHYSNSNRVQSNSFFLKLYLQTKERLGSHTYSGLMNSISEDARNNSIPTILEAALKNDQDQVKINSLPDLEKRCETELAAWEKNNFRKLFLDFLNGDISESLLPEETTRMMIGYTLSQTEETVIDKLVLMLEYGTDNSDGYYAKILSRIILVSLLHGRISDYSHYKELFKANVEIKDDTVTAYKNSFTGCMFLNGRDNKPVVKLSDVFQVPSFDAFDIPGFSQFDTEYSPSENLNHMLAAFFKGCYRDKQQPNSDCNRILTILGDPGSGKSSLIEYMLNNESVLQLMEWNSFTKVKVFRFAEFTSGKIKWDNLGELFSSLLEACGYTMVNNRLQSADDLENTLLIFDGFDEIDVRNRHEIIKNLKAAFERRRNGFSNCGVIITCRLNYIESQDDDDERIKKIESYICLNPLNQSQIQSFCSAYNSIMRDKNWPEYDSNIFKSDILFRREDENGHKVEPLGDILGIPLILYMVVAEEVPLSENGNIQSVTDIYDELFIPENGVLDPSDKPAWDIDVIRNSLEAEIPVKEQLLQISKLIAVEMFRTRPSKAEIQSTILNQLTEDAKERLKKDSRISPVKDNEQTPINQTAEGLKIRTLGDTFLRANKYVEGITSGGTLSYVHRSIYEYFTARYIFDQIVAINKVLLSTDWTDKVPSIESAEAENMLFAVNSLRAILQSRLLTSDIRKHLVRKLEKEFIPSGNGSQNRCAKIASIQLWSDLFDSLLEEGFLYTASEDNSSSKLELIKDNPAFARIKPAMLQNVKQEISAFLNFADIIRILDNMSPSAEGETDDWIRLYSEQNKTVFNQYLRIAIEEIKNELINDMKSSAKSDDESAADDSVQKADPILISGLDLSHLDLQGLNLSNMDLLNINFDGSNLSGCNLSRCTFEKVSLTGTNLSKADLSNCSFRNLKVNSADSGNAKTVFSGAQLCGADLQKSAFADADFTRCHLEGCCAYSADLSNADFTGAFLDGADLVEAKFIGAHFNYASMIRANLEDADCTGADFTGAQLFDTKWNGAAVEEQSFDADGLDAVKRGDGQF